MATFKDVAEQFLNGAVEGVSSGQGNLKISDDVLIHYSTPISERCGEKYILNMTRYSLVTGRLQKQLKEMIPEGQLVIVKRVPEGYKGSLKEFVEENKNE